MVRCHLVASLLHCCGCAEQIVPFFALLHLALMGILIASRQGPSTCGVLVADLFPLVRSAFIVPRARARAVLCLPRSVAFGVWLVAF